MRRIISLFTIVTAILGGVVLFSGCSTMLTLCERVYPPLAPPGRWDGPAQAGGARGELFFDSTAASTMDEVEGILALDHAPPGYVPMTPQTVQCLAVEAASTPALIDHEMNLLCYLAGVSIDRRTRVLWIQKDLSELRATDLRNDAAANALTLYYNIAAAEAQRDLLPKLLYELAETKKILNQYKMTGRDIPTDDTELDRQEITIRQQQRQLALTISQLNGKLRLLLSSPPGPAPWIWPEDRFVVTPTTIDIGGAIGFGLRQRADLASLRIVHSELDQDTLPIAQVVLRQRDGVLGIPSTQHPLFQKDRIARELGVRDCQLAMLLTTAEQAAIDEIRTAAQDVAQALREIAAAKESLTSRTGRLETVEKRIQVGRMGRHEAPLARIEILRAKGEVIQKIVDWKVAHVKLKQSQGVLSAECGYPRCFVLQYRLDCYPRWTCAQTAPQAVGPPGELIVADPQGNQENQPFSSRRR